jgi:hypothetical protein
MSTSANCDDGLSVTELQTILDGNLSPDARRFVIARQWTLNETPPITNEAEYEIYCLRLEAFDFPDPVLDPAAWTSWIQSPAGIQAIAIDARILEWQEGNYRLHQPQF